MPSSVVHRFHYDPERQVLTVVYVSGNVYEYLEVPEKVYEEMKASFSKGTYLNQHIKRKYKFKKID